MVFATPRSDARRSADASGLNPSDDLCRIYRDIHRDLLAIAVVELRACRDLLVVGGAGSGRLQALRDITARLDGAIALRHIPNLDRVPDAATATSAIRARPTTGGQTGSDAPSPLVLATSLPHQAALAQCRQYFAAAGRGEPAVLTLGDLEVAGVMHLAREILGEPLTDPSAATVLEQTGGRYFDVQALLLAAQSRHQLHREGRRWAFGDMPEAPVDSHRCSAPCHDDARAGSAAIERIALLGVASLDALHAVFDNRVIKRLISNGVLRPTVDPYAETRADDTYGLARLACAGHVIEGLSAAKRAAHLDMLVAKLPNASLNRSLARRYAKWALERDQGEPHIVHDEAWRAYRQGDLARAEDAANWLIGTRFAAQGRVLRGAVHARRGNLAAAIHDIPIAAEVDTNKNAVREARVVAGLAEAIDMASKAADITDDVSESLQPESNMRITAAVTAHQALAHALAGNPIAAERALDRVDARAGDMTRELAAASHAAIAVAKVDARQIGLAQSVWRAGTAGPVRPIPVAPNAIDAHAVELQVVAGQNVTVLQKQARTGVRRARGSLDRYAFVTWGIAVATADLAAGNIAGALDMTHETLVVARETGQRTPIPLVLARRAWASIHAGAFETAMSTLDDLARLEAATVRLDLCTSAIAAFSSPADAADIMVSAAQRSRSSGNLAGAIEACGVVLRLGAPTAAFISLLTELHAHVAAPRTAVMVAHAEALRLGDADLLDRISRRYVRMGRRLSAADASAQAAAASDSVRYRHRSSALLATCPQAWIGVASAEPCLRLTDRERDVATRAVGGCSNDSIAAELSLSIRSVETYLSAVYRKLGVRGRSELTTFHAPMFATAADQQQQTRDPAKQIELSGPR